MCIRSSNQGRRVNKNGNNGPIVTSFTKVLQVERIVEDLINGVPLIFSGTHLVFDNQDQAAANHYGIYALAHSRNYKLEKDEAVWKDGRDTLQVDNFCPPCTALLFVDRK